MTDGHFTFEHNGETYEMPNKTTDVITYGFIRKNRRRDETDYTATALEALAGDGEEGRRVLDVLDSLTAKEFRAVNSAFSEHLGATLGE